MTTRYFKVRYEAGAYIDDLYYRKDDIVPLEVGKDEQPPLWGVEVDQHGNEIGVDRSAAVQNKLASGLANKIAGKNPAKDADDDDDSGKGTGGAELSAEQKEQVKSALDLLDHGDKAHWTARGLPNTEAVSALVGFPVERKDINEIAPDFQREDKK